MECINYNINDDSSRRVGSGGGSHCGDFLVFQLSSPPIFPARVCTDDYQLLVDFK